MESIIVAENSITKKPIWISDVTDDNRYRGIAECYDCGEDLVAVLCQTKRDHWRHKGDSSCSGGGDMTAQHLFCQEIVEKYLHEIQFRDCSRCMKVLTIPPEFTCKL